MTNKSCHFSFGQSTPRKHAKPVLQPAGLRLFKERISVNEIAWQVDKRSLDDLDAQVTDALQQILVRAHAGDDEALALYFIITRQAVMSFDSLVRHEPERLRAVAEQSSNLPVLLSLNPKDIEAAKERMQLFNVGAKAILPTHSDQRTDRRNHWTQLAIYAFNACLENIRRMPQVSLAGAEIKRVKRKLWGTAETGTEYMLPDGSRVVIADWQGECAKLTVPIAAENFNQWRSVIKMCVLEFWHRSKNEYGTALEKIGNSGQPESYRRHLAMNRTLQAFKSQFLRQ